MKDDWLHSCRVGGACRESSAACVLLCTFFYVCSVCVCCCAHFSMYVVCMCMCVVVHFLFVCSVCVCCYAYFSMYVVCVCPVCTLFILMPSSSCPYLLHCLPVMLPWGLTPWIHAKLTCRQGRHSPPKSEGAQSM